MVPGFGRGLGFRVYRGLALGLGSMFNGSVFRTWFRV